MDQCPKIAALQRAIFENKQASRSLRYISADWDVHSVGVWKGAATIKDLTTKTNRTGTFDSLLRYLKE